MARSNQQAVKYQPQARTEGRRRAPQQTAQRRPAPNQGYRQRSGASQSSRPRSGAHPGSRTRTAASAGQPQAQKRRPAQAYAQAQAHSQVRQPSLRGQQGNPEAVRPAKKKVRHFYDYSLLFCIIFLTVFGLVMIYSASAYRAQLDYNGDAAYFMTRQAKIAAVSFVMMLIISKIDYHFFARFAVLGYGMSYVLMIAVTLFGKDVNGSRRWLQVGPVSFQPTEFVKIALILMLAALINEMGSRINQWKSMGVIAAMSLPLAGIVAANNLSSGIIIAGIAFVMLFVACRIKWPFFAVGGLGLGVLTFAGPIGGFLYKINLLKGYQYDRILAWLNPESDPTDKGFQVLQGLYAIGSGGLTGQGLGESIQKLGFLPEAQNDMIFSIICEELGLFGAISVILIFLFMIYRFMLIAGNSPDLFGAMLVVGVMGHIAIQVILNIAVVTNTIPNTGITLPFISYGGTSVMFLMMEMGMVLSVSNRIRLEK